MKEINIEKHNSRDIFEGMEMEKWYFTQMPNYVLQNIDNAVAQGVWTHIQSLPPEWNLNKTYIINKFKLSEKLYKKTMSYLKKCNLIAYKKYRNDSGSFIKTKILVKSGSKFIHPKDHSNKEIQLNPPLNANIFETLPTGVEKEPVVELLVSTGVDSHPCGYPPVSEKTSLIKKTDIKKKTKNKKTTTTSKKSSCSLIDIRPLQEFGFTKVHKNQLGALDVSHELINESVLNYREALKDKAFRDKTQNKAAYFMYVMRNVGFYDAPGKRVFTPEEKQARYLIENNVDNRYDI